MASPLEQLQAEIRESKLEADLRAKELAANNLYRIQRVKVSKVYNAFKDANSLYPYDLVTESVEQHELRYADLDRFAQYHGIDRVKLQSALENRIKEVKDKNGSIWRAYPWSWVPKPVRDDSTDVEQEAFIKKMEARSKRAKQATADNAVTVPTLSSFMSEEVQGASKQ